MNMQAYLEPSEIIDWQNPEILELAHRLALTCQTTAEIAKSCFEWVRDRIHHSYDYQMNPVTYRASDVLKYQTGYCFAKSHLLAALLRANQIPAGFCYQRLIIDNPPENTQIKQQIPCTLHGLNAIFLPEIGWYRVDPRGNRDGVDAQFIPPQEQLAFEINLPQEADFITVLAEPLPIVVQALAESKTWDDLLLHLPDITLKIWQEYHLVSQMEGYQIKALTNTDESTLLPMLMHAAHESSLENVRSRSVGFAESNPDLFRYVKDWGRSGDIGFVAIDNTPIGAAWLRLFSSDNRGFGYIDDLTPELAIAVFPEYRDRGIGTKLLTQIIEVAGDLYPAISLSVRANNPVISLYQRVGFVKVDGSEIINRTGETSSFNMIYRYS